MNNKIRVLLADDHPLVRKGIRATLTDEADFIVVGEAADGDMVLRLCCELQPDVLLLDLSMPNSSPLEILAYLRIHCANLKVLVLTAYDDEAYIYGLVAAGVEDAGADPAAGSDPAPGSDPDPAVGVDGDTVRPGALDTSSPPRGPGGSCPKLADNVRPRARAER